MFNLKNCLNNQDPLLIKKVMIRNILSLQSALDMIVHPKHFLYSSATLILSDANPLQDAVPELPPQHSQPCHTGHRWNTRAKSR